ncbi:tetratricopeptide repeat protein 21B-like [Athalia rosae]|uniref:tetratricopeptide repeat protein 21B-like n=1 Tax=Athalia rosae TaxID=37344 RepID=UPI002033FE75|nr:tetratricopeptide repeat protein 21B-like [Athalia rosae]XP_020711624.2 tetratricopeptide repeat protein 21B-like [Athalia rosae]
MDESEYKALLQWYCRNRYYNGMLFHSKQACDAHPSSESLRILLALAFALTGQGREAVKEVSGLIGYGDTTLAALITQSYAHRLNNNADRGSLTQIETRIREDRRKATPQALTLAAMVLFLLGKADKAKEYADRAYKTTPTNIDVLLIKGWIHLNSPKDQIVGKLTDYFELVLKQDRKHLNALLGSAKLKEYNAQHEAAISLLNSVIVRYPKLSMPLTEKMSNQLAMKDWEQALETANRILLLDSANTSAIQLKAISSFCRDGDYQEGLKYLQTFFRNLSLSEPKNMHLLIDGVQLFSRITGKNLTILSELAKVTEKCVQQNPQNGDVMVELGNLNVLMGKVKVAEHWYRSTVRIDESSLSALMGLAHCQLLDTSSGATDLARQQIDFLREIQVNATSPEIFYMSAILSNHDPSAAVNYLDMAVTILLENCKEIPYGLKYLTTLNPDFCLEIVKQYLIFLPSTSSIGSTDTDLLSETLTKQCLNILEKVCDACPGLGAALMMLGKVRMQSGNFEGASVALRKLLDSVDPNSAPAHLLMAQILARQGKYQQASQSLEVGLSYNFKVRDDPMYHLIIGLVEKDNGDLNSCIHSLRVAMSYAGLMPGEGIPTTPIPITDKATLYLELISAYSKIRKFNDALLLMDEAKSELSGTVEEGRITIGNAELCLEMGDIDNAINLLSKILPGQPYYLQAHTRLAEIHLNSRKDRHAFAKCFRELVEHSPGSKTYSMLGDAYIAIQEPDRAIEAYEQSLKKNPSDKLLANKMGKALVKTHQYAKAITYYKEATKQEGCGDLKLDMAELFMKMKQFDKAEATLAQELQDGRSANDLPSLELRTKQLLLLARVRERAGNMQAALATLREARENQSRAAQRAAVTPGAIGQKELLAQICLSMAEHASSLRDFDQAIVHYKEALNHKSADIKALLSLAKIYMQVNDLDRCAQSCTALLTTDPNNEAALVMMADLAFRKVDFETAAYHFRQLLIRQPTYWTALARLIEVSRRTGNMDDLHEWITNAETHMGTKEEAGFSYCAGLLDWRLGKLNSALRHFNAARRDPEWGQQAIYNMIDICLDPDDDSALYNDTFNDDLEYQDSRSLALKTAQRLLQELNPKGGIQEMLTHRLLSNFFLLATKQKSNIERALQDCTALASQDALKDHVGPALGLATAHILLKQTPRARNHLKRVSRNVWSFEDAEYLERCWVLLADIYVQSSKYEMAAELLKRVLQHNATCVRAHELSGYIAEKEQNYREAAIQYSEAWKYGGRSKLSVGYKLAYCHMKSKAYADAIEICNEVLKQKSDYPRIRKDILEKSMNNLRT